MTDLPSRAQIEDIEDDHEQYVGKVIADPWSDPSQTDWGNAKPILDPEDPEAEFDDDYDDEDGE